MNKRIKMWDFGRNIFWVSLQTFCNQANAFLQNKIHNTFVVFNFSLVPFSNFHANDWNRIIRYERIYLQLLFSKCISNEFCIKSFSYSFSERKNYINFLKNVFPKKSKKEILLSIFIKFWALFCTNDGLKQSLKYIQNWNFYKNRAYANVIEMEVVRCVGLSSFSWLKIEFQLLCVVYFVSFLWNARAAVECVQCFDIMAL